MLRGGLTLDIGWAVAVIVPVLMWIFLTFAEKDESKGPYVEGKLEKKNSIVLGVFLVLVAIMTILTAIFVEV